MNGAHAYLCFIYSFSSIFFLYLYSLLLLLQLHRAMFLMFIVSMYTLAIKRSCRCGWYGERCGHSIPGQTLIKGKQLHFGV